MPAPGSPHALVLPSATDTSDEAVPVGERAATLLAPFLDATQYASIAVVHGLGRTAPKAFDLAKQRLERGRGLVWLPDPELLDVLTGPHAAVLKRVLKPKDGCVMTFVSVQSQRVVEKLEWYRLGIAEIDLRFARAGLA